MGFSKKKIGGEIPFIFDKKYNKAFNKNSFENLNYFFSGRNAILEVIKNEEVKTLYVPKYYCYPVYDLLISIKGLETYNYGSKDELLKKFSKNYKGEKSLIIILLFNGMRDSINKYLEIQQIKNKNSISLIDAAMTPSIPKIDFDYDYLVTNPRKFYWLPLGTFLFSKKSASIKFNLSFNFLNSIIYLSSKIVSRFLLSSRLDSLERVGLEINNYAENKVPISLDLFSFLIIKNLKIKDLSAKRIKQYNIYFELLKPIKEFYFFKIMASSKDCPFGFILRIKERDELMRFLNSHRIFPSTLWQPPLVFNDEIGPETVTISKEILLLPIGDHYNSKDIKKVCKFVLKFFNDGKHL